MADIERLSIAGVCLDVATRADILARVLAWSRNTQSRSKIVCFVNAFSIVSASKDKELLRAINDSDLSIADGVPVAWLGRRVAGAPIDRVSGPDLMHRFLSDPVYADLRHFVYGGGQEPLDRLEFRYNLGGTLRPRRIVGTYSPPYRDLTEQEEDAFLARMVSLKPDILWVCLGTDRQEKWMARMRDRLSVPVILGVGAAVDFLSGTKSRAPVWMQRAGLEWLFRLASEPRRLWRRYLIGNVVFLRLASAELVRARSRQGDAV